MQIKRILILLAIISVLTFSFHTDYSFAIDIPNKLDATSAILLDTEKGQILYAKNSSEKLHISSSNKIMTAILALEKAKPDSIVTISKEALAVEGSILNLEVGGKYSVEDLVISILLTPANDAGYALAEYIGEDINSFVKLMNDKAMELKMKDTKYANPTGISDVDQFTTASDLSVLMLYALNNPNFDRLFSLKGMPFNSQILINRNKLFWMYDGVDGGKLGYNNKNKQSAITTVTKGKQRLLSIVLDSTIKNIWNDSINILEYGFNYFVHGILINKNQRLKSIIVDKNEIDLISLQDIYYTYPIGDYYIQNVNFEINKNIKLPIKKSVSLGVANYLLKDGTIISISLYPDKDVAAVIDYSSFIKTKIGENIEAVYLILFLLLIEIMLIFYKLTAFIKRRHH